MKKMVLVKVFYAAESVATALSTAKQAYETAVEEYRLNLAQFDKQDLARVDRLGKIYNLLEEQWLHSGSAFRRPSKRLRPEYKNRLIYFHLELPDTIRQALMDDPDMEIHVVEYVGWTETFVCLKPVNEPRPPFALGDRMNRLESLQRLLIQAQEQNIEHVVIDEKLILEDGLNITPDYCLVLS